MNKREWQEEVLFIQTSNARITSFLNFFLSHFTWPEAPSHLNGNYLILVIADPSPSCLKIHRKLELLCCQKGKEEPCSWSGVVSTNCPLGTLRWFTALTTDATTRLSSLIPPSRALGAQSLPVCHFPSVSSSCKKLKFHVRALQLPLLIFLLQSLFVPWSNPI